MILHYIDIIWPEPQTNEAPVLSKPLEEFEEILEAEFLPVQNPYYFTLEDESKIFLTQRAVINPEAHYTFSLPIWIDIQERGRKLFFKATQSFLTQEGIQTVRLTITYTESD